MRRYLLPLGVGALGYCLAWGAVHAYQDHLLLHAVVQALSQPVQPAPAPAKAPDPAK